MSGFADAANAIEARLAANWTATPIQYENAPLKEPASAYVACYIRDGEGTQISLGAPALRRWPGIIMLHVLVPERSGTRQARAYADGLAPIFDRAQFSQGNSGVISCRTPSIELIGVQEGWWHINVTVPYHRDREY